MLRAPACPQPLPSSTRENLASIYRILAHWGVDDHTYTHVSARCHNDNSFLICPFGLRFNEVTPECLIEVSLDGNILNGQKHHYNQTGYIIHGAIYKRRPDISWIIHIHTPEIVAVSACEQGLMPISQWALHFYDRVSYHGYDALALHADQGEHIAHDLGPNCTMLMRNHGSLTCGRTPQEAVFYTHHLQMACKAQCLALAMNQDLVMPPPDVCERSVHDFLTFEEDLGARDWQAWLRCIN